MSLFEDTNPRALKALLAKIRNTPGLQFANMLASHGLPTVVDSPLLRDNYEGSLTRRQEDLWQETWRVTGTMVLRISKPTSMTKERGRDGRTGQRA
jgi:hypothetical protein